MAQYVEDPKVRLQLERITALLEKILAELKKQTKGTHHE